MIETMPAELAENLIDFCENRSRVYALLSRCYETEIDAAFAEALAGEAALASDDAGLAAGFAALQADLAGCDEDALEQLAVVFDRAFFGMGPRTAQKAFPYESVYTSEGGLMMQDAYAEVLHVYRGAGFAKNPGFKEPEDHLAVELAFMALLCGRAVEALRAGGAGGGRAPAARPAGVPERPSAELDRPLHVRCAQGCRRRFLFRLGDVHRRLPDRRRGRACRSAGVAACDRGTNFRFGHGGRRAGNSDQALRKCMVCYSPKSRRNLRPNRVFVPDSADLTDG